MSLSKTSFPTTTGTFALIGPVWATQDQTTTARPGLERGLILGVALLSVGLAGFVVAVLTWAHHGFGELTLAASLRLAIPTVTALSLGAEMLMASFFLGLLQFDRQISNLRCLSAAGQERPYRDHE